MSPVALTVGILALLTAVFVFIFFTLSPPRVRVPVARRIAEESAPTSRLAKINLVGQRFAGQLLRMNMFRRVAALDLEQADIALPLTSFVLAVMYGAIALAIFGAALAGFGPWSLLSALFFASLSIFAAKFILDSRARRRRDRFADQLDETLLIIAGALRAGHGLMRALDAVSKESESPTREEFERVVSQNRVGIDLGDSLVDLAERMQSQDFLWVAQAISINREVGGNLAETLDGVSATIRERAQIRRQVTALSAEGRLSAYVLIALPVGVFFFLLIVQPNYFASFFTSIFGIIAIVLAVILLVVGSIWMSKVVKVKF